MHRVLGICKEIEGAAWLVLGAGCWARLRPWTAEFAASLHMDLEPLQEIAELLEENRQLVLYGP
ncbi:MAG TPA: hypothetical protein VLR70_04855, partial [Arthrobacter sp.]|nr:hypothetical protein [Arthrobacter sp.]